MLILSYVMSHHLDAVRHVSQHRLAGRRGRRQPANRGALTGQLQLRQLVLRVRRRIVHIVGLVDSLQVTQHYRHIQNVV